MSKKPKKPEAKGLDALTTRERDVLIFCSKGFTNEEVGALMDLSKFTVADYVRGIFAKLEVNTKVEAAVIAAKAGLV